MRFSLTVAAEAEKQAAQDRAEAVRIAAEAEAEKHRLQAKGEADAKILLAQAQEQQYKVDAEGTRAVNEAANVLSVEQVEMQVRLALLKHLPDIIRESVRPMEKSMTSRFCKSMVWGALPVVQTVQKVFQTAKPHKPALQTKWSTAPCATAAKPVG